MVYGVDGSGVDAASFRSFLRLALPVVACRYLFFSTFSTRVPYIRRTRIAKDRQVGGRCRVPPMCHDAQQGLTYVEIST